MRIIDYVRRTAAPEFMDVERALETRDTTVVSEWAPPEANSSLLDAKTEAYSDAPPAGGRFPLVLYAGGVNPYTLSNVVLAEFLATHGFVTVAVPSLGPTTAQPDQRYNTAELQDSLRDLEFAWSTLRDAPNVAPTKLASVGHSLGGTIALLIALHNQNVSAVVGLDGTYGFAGDEGVAAFMAAYDPSRATLAAGLLEMRRADADIDLRPLHAFQNADRYFVKMSGMFHGDFTSFVMGARAFHLGPPPNVPPDWTREAGYSGYQRVCVGVWDFLRGTLDGDDRLLFRWQESLSDAGISVVHERPLTR
jgi:dienelactone hydrolase